jgi:integrase
MPLKELEVRYTERRSKPFKLFDGGGLHLLVKPNGSKLWRLKYRANGRENTLSLGKYPAVSLAAARSKRNAAKVDLDRGIDPAPRASTDTPRAPGQSFAEIARSWHANRKEGLCAAHAERVWRRMERDVLPVIGDQAISAITAPIILSVIRQVEARGALDVSRRLKQGISQVFRFAIANGWAKDDPSIHLLGALKPKPRVRHMARVPLKEMPKLFRAIRDYDGEEGPYRRAVTRDALIFTLLTWARTSEVRFATWDEFEDLGGDAPLWRVPAERMKMRREHIVPLSLQAADLLRKRRFASNELFVFPGEKPGQPISANTMIFACYRMGYRSKQTVHGFRGLGSTWANEAQCYPSDWIELALAHADENEVRGAYNGALYLDGRRSMLQGWADMIDRSINVHPAIVDAEGLPG